MISHQNIHKLPFWRENQWENFSYWRILWGNFSSTFVLKLWLTFKIHSCNNHILSFSGLRGNPWATSLSILKGLPCPFHLTGLLLLWLNNLHFLITISLLCLVFRIVLIHSLKSVSGFWSSVFKISPWSFAFLYTLFGCKVLGTHWTQSALTFIIRIV